MNIISMLSRIMNNGKTMKAIIIAAGQGSRLKNLTIDKPKCMLKIGDKTILEMQLDVLRPCGIDDIVVIKGYKKEKIDYKGIRYFINDNYANNNILNSLFCAKEEIEGDIIISYSDIIYNRSVLEELLKSKNDIAIVTDINWREHYRGRTEHPLEEAENVVMDTTTRLIEIGKIVADKKMVHGEFIGLMKLTRKGSMIFRENYEEAKTHYWGKPFYRAADFEKAYLTDMLQDLVVSGIDIHCVVIKNGWMEIDTVQDYNSAIKGNWSL